MEKRRIRRFTDKKVQYDESAKRLLGQKSILAIITMHNNGFTAEQIAPAIDKDIKEIEAIVKGKELELA